MYTYKSSGDSYVVPPVPIPNTVVKHIHAEGTWLETAWENRELLVKCHVFAKQMHDLYGALVKWLRLRPLTAASRVRIPYASPTKILMGYHLGDTPFFVFFSLLKPKACD